MAAYRALAVAASAALAEELGMQASALGRQASAAKCLTAEAEAYWRLADPYHR